MIIFTVHDLRKNIEKDFSIGFYFEYFDFMNIFIDLF